MQVSIWWENDNVVVIDQRNLPFTFQTKTLATFDEACFAISSMMVRGAPLIGMVAAWAAVLAIRESSSGDLQEKTNQLVNLRPTAVNLFTGAMRVFEKAGNDQTKALSEARLFIEEEMDACKRIGEEGLVIIRQLYAQKKDKERFSILTHCNAGWLACGGFGTALSPIYAAHNAGLPVHVWVDETRPRNQGAKLTAWELKQSGVPFTVIPDNAGGQLMREGKVDMAIVGADRVAMNGDVANKTGTYLKALAAHDNGVPFFVALPASTFDRNTGNGNQIHIEYRSTTEVTEMNGLDEKGHEVSIKIIPDEFPVLNPGFDVTPAKLVTSLITERGICNASKDSILKLFPEFM